MKCYLNTLAAAAVALTAVTPGFAQSKLDQQLVDALDEVVREIGKIEDLEEREGTLVEAYEYLNNEVFESLFARPTMVTITLTRGDASHPNAKDNHTFQKKNDVGREPANGESSLEQADKDRFPKLSNGDLDPAWIMLHFEVGSTRECVYTSTGKFCFRQPRN